MSGVGIGKVLRGQTGVERGHTWVWRGSDRAQGLMGLERSHLSR
jgi:hypothetical protein